MAAAIFVGRQFVCNPCSFIWKPKTRIPKIWVSHRKVGAVFAVCAGPQDRNSVMNRHESSSAWRNQVLTVQKEKEEMKEEEEEAELEREMEHVLQSIEEESKRDADDYHRRADLFSTIGSYVSAHSPQNS